MEYPISAKKRLHNWKKCLIMDDLTKNFMLTEGWAAGIWTSRGCGIEGFATTRRSLTNMRFVGYNRRLVDNFCQSSFLCVNLHRSCFNFFSFFTSTKCK